MARKKKAECKVPPAWLTSFSDLMSLLLTFFILLYSMSSLDVSKAVKFLHYFQGDDAKFESHISIIKPIVPFTTDVARQVKKRIRRQLPIHAYQIASTEEYVNIRLFNDVFFEKNSLRLSGAAKRMLDNLSGLLSKLDDNLSINVQGFSSSGLPKGYKGDLWSFSLKRAMAVLDYLVQKRVDPSMLSVTGYGDVKPLYTWNNPLLNRRNNRVEIVLQVIESDTLKPPKR